MTLALCRYDAYRMCSVCCMRTLQTLALCRYDVRTQEGLNMKCVLYVVCVQNVLCMLQAYSVDICVVSMQCKDSRRATYESEKRMCSVCCMSILVLYNIQNTFSLPSPAKPSLRPYTALPITQHAEHILSCSSPYTTSPQRESPQNTLTEYRTHSLFAHLIKPLRVRTSHHHKANRYNNSCHIHHTQLILSSLTHPIPREYKNHITTQPIYQGHP